MLDAAQIVQALLEENLPDYLELQARWDWNTASWEWNMSWPPGREKVITGFNIRANKQAGQWDGSLISVARLKLPVIRFLFVIGQPEELSIEDPDFGNKFKKMIRSRWSV